MLYLPEILLTEKSLDNNDIGYIICKEHDEYAIYRTAENGHTLVSKVGNEEHAKNIVKVLNTEINQLRKRGLL